MQYGTEKSQQHLCFEINKLHMQYGTCFSFENDVT